ncbi:MAG: cytochrome c peroxidase [Sphingomonadales bacterium]
MTYRTSTSLIALALALAGCSGGSNTNATSASIAAVPVTTTTTPPATASLPGASALLTIDFNNLAEYGAPTLPVYYDATVTALDNTPNNNAISNRIATLGRVLFWDRQLSVNAGISCASCHRQAFGFDDPNRFSTGFSGAQFTTAHAMRLGNVRYWRPGTMFWDRRAASVEAQASQPIINPIELGWDAGAGGINALVARLQALPYYQELFAFAFGSSVVSEARITQALAQFERAMISSNSRWDTAYAQVFSATAQNRALNVTLPGFTDQENRGRQLFMTGPAGGGAGCSSCHQPPTFALAANSQSNGLDAGETRIFKAPSLKNVGLSKAYMHDGRFATLDEVVEFYNSGIQLGPALDNRLKAPGGAAPLRLNLTAADKAALVAFLQTLNDPVLVGDPRFTSPFK